MKEIPCDAIGLQNLQFVGIPLGDAAVSITAQWQYT